MADEMIDAANEEFDLAAVPLGRKINELRERLKKEDQPADTRRGERKRKAPLTDGLDPDDVAHLNELLARRKKR